MAQPGTRLARPYLHWVGRLMRLPWPPAAAPGLPSPGAATGAAVPSAEPGRT